MTMQQMLRSCSLALFIVIFSWSLSSAQPSPLNLKVENIDNSVFPQVKVLLSVSDAQGFPITGLDRNSFKVSEDNIPITDFVVSQFNNIEQPLAIVLVIDTSGSMAGKPLANSVTAAKDFISTLTSGDLVALISFSNKATILQELTSDHGKIVEALDGLKADGDTAHYDALVEATNLLKNRSERRVIVSLTDGKESGISKFTFDQVVNEAVRWSTPVYPIGFGGVNKDELDRLAKLTGGFAQINPDTTTLSTAFQNVLNNLREQYSIEFVSSLSADGLEHNLDVALNYQDGSASASRKFVAKPGQVSLSLPDLQDGQTVGGMILIKPEVLAPAALDRLDISIDGGPLSSVLAPPYEYLWDSTSMTPGEHKLDVKATDLANNVGSLVISLNIRQPIIVTAGFSPGQVISGDIKIPATVDALASISKVEFFLDEKLLGESTTPPYEIEWNTSKVSPGFHDIKIKATDANGVSAETTVQVNLEIQRSSNLLWMALIAVLVAGAIIIPLAVRNNQQTKRGKAGPQVDSAIMQAKNQAFLVEKEGVNPGQTWPLVSEETRLGRKRDENDIPLKGLKASRYQALIRSQPEGYVLYSLVPENPMIVNGVPASEQVLLQNGDLIQAGESQFTFEVQA